MPLQNLCSCSQCALLISVESELSNGESFLLSVEDINKLDAAITHYEPLFKKWLDAEDGRPSYRYVVNKLSLDGDCNYLRKKILF